VTPVNVLVAEDNALNFELVHDLLEALGHTVQWARDGDETLALARSGKFDLLLLDLHMPRLNGLEVMLALTEDASITNLKVIVLTADAMLGVRDEMFAAGVDGYVCKPINIAVLVNEMEAVLDQAPEPGPRPVPSSGRSDLQASA
jgi:CheY-like chemotaxis protein